MEKSNYHITLDLQESHGGQMLTLHQNDPCRRIYIPLTDGGRPYRLGSGCRGVFTAKKSDGAAIFNDCEIEGDTLIYDITEQTTASCGELSCQLRLYGETGELLSTAAFSAMVYPPAVSDDDVVASTPEATALQSLLDRVENATREKSYELIEEVTLEEDVSSFLRTADPQDNHYNFSAIRIFIQTAKSTGTAQVIFSIGSETSNNYVYYQKNDILVANKEQDAIYRQYNDNGRMFFEGAANTKNTAGTFGARLSYLDKEWKNVTRIALTVNSDTVRIPAGTTIKIYGIRG